MTTIVGREVIKMNYSTILVLLCLFYAVVYIILLCIPIRHPNKQYQNSCEDLYPMMMAQQGLFMHTQWNPIPTMYDNSSSMNHHNPTPSDLTYDSSYVVPMESGSNVLMAPPGVPEGFDELLSKTTADDNDIEHDPTCILAAQEHAEFLKEQEQNDMLANSYMTSSFHI